MTGLGNESAEDLRKFLKGFHFAILHHVFPTDSARLSHWDLLLEHPELDPDQVLCFQVLVPPSQWQHPTPIQRLPNHRRIYLTYEGPISNNRGQVTQVLAGKLGWLPGSISTLCAFVSDWNNKNKAYERSSLGSNPMTSFRLHRDQTFPPPSPDLNGPFASNEPWTLATTHWPIHNDPA